MKILLHMQMVLLWQGMPFGVYFFSQATTTAEAKEEAKTVIDALKNYKVDYPVVFDTELIPNSLARANDLDVESLTEIADAFCKTTNRQDMSL